MSKITIMKLKKVKSSNAFSIIEVMIAMAVLLIAILGTSSFRYHAALNARRADLQTTSSRVALMLCEGWTGVGGDTNNFDPVSALAPDVNIISSVGPPGGFTNTLGSYKIGLEGNDYYATLSWKNLAQDAAGRVELRALNVVVSWDQFGRGHGTFTNANKLYQLTTYVENPN